MKKSLLFFCLFFILSCSSSEDEGEVAPTNPTEFKFEYNIHSSLPSDWVTEFNKIMKNLDILIKVKPTVLV